MPRSLGARALPADPSTHEIVRSLTLEHGEGVTFLGEWTACGVHRTHGLGPAADEGAFYYAVLALLGPLASPVTALATGRALVAREGLTERSGARTEFGTESGMRTESRTER